MNWIKTFPLFLIFFIFSFCRANLSPHLPLAVPQESRNYCRGASLSCPSNQVLVPREATFISLKANMTCHKNKTLKLTQFLQNLNQLNPCKANVFRLVEFLCFAKLTCEVEITEELMKFVDGECDLSSFGFFNISFDCLPIEQTPCYDCESTYYAMLEQPQGYLSSVVVLNEASSSHCGTSKCPWKIQTSPGHVVNLTFIQASYAADVNTTNNECHNKKLLTSKEAVNPKQVHFCPGSHQRSHIYTSVGNLMEVYFHQEKLSNIGDQYLILYQTIGCPDITPPKFSRMRRVLDQLVVECPEAKIKWVMKCGSDGKWRGLEKMGTCPPYPGFENVDYSPLADKRVAGSEKEGGGLFNTLLFNIPMGVLMALIIASALVLGVFILTVGIVCMKKHHYDIKHKDDANVYGAACSEFEFREMRGGSSFIQGKSLQGSKGESRRSSGDLLARDNTYNMQEMVRMDARPLPSLPNASWRRTDGGPPVPYGVFPTAGPHNRGPGPHSRVAVQFHRGADSESIASCYQGNPAQKQYYTQRTPSVMHQQRYMSPGIGDPRLCGPRVPFNPNQLQGQMGGQDENHLYFVLDGNAPDEKVLPQTLKMTQNGPPPAHQNFTTSPRVQPASILTSAQKNNFNK